MKYLIDTNVWIDAVSGRLPEDDFLNLILRSEWSGFSAITRLELFGFPGLRGEEEQKLSDLLSFFAEVDVTSTVIDQAIQIRRQKRIKVPDAIIAATALVKNCVLLTRNMDDFKNIQGLAVVNPHIG